MKFGLLVCIALLASCGNPQEAPQASDRLIDASVLAPFIPDCEARAPSNDVEEFQCRWEYRALTLQRQLGMNLPLREAQIFSSHNSYNSSAYPGVSSSDLNQTRTLTEQLQLGVRSFELDVHWIPHLASGGLAPVTCHGLGASQEHLGCTALDRHLNESLEEIAAFLESDQGQGQVLFMDLEDHLSPGPISGAGSSSEEAHAAALEAIIQTLGPYIYQPEQNSGCQATPMDLTQADILAAGKSILLNAPCEAEDWASWAFEVNSVRPGQKAHTGFTGYPECDSESFDFAQYRERWVREWEDTTLVGAATNTALQRMSDAQLQDMAHCGVNFASLDRIDPNPQTIELGNPRYLGQGINFAAMIWSWAEGKPAQHETQDCAFLDVAEGRFHDADCTTQRPFACLRNSAYSAPMTRADELWLIHGSGPFGTAECPNGHRFARPENGWLKQQLVEAAEQAGATEIWLNYRESEAHHWH